MPIYNVIEHAMVHVFFVAEIKKKNVPVKKKREKKKRRAAYKQHTTGIKDGNLDFISLFFSMSFKLSLNIF